MTPAQLAAMNESVQVHREEIRILKEDMARKSAEEKAAAKRAEEEKAERERLLAEKERLEAEKARRKELARMDAEKERTERARKGKGVASGSEKMKPGVPAVRVMSHRKVIPDLFIDDSIFEIIPGKFLELMNVFQGWENLFRTGVVVDEELVKEFYSQLSVASSDEAAEAKVVVKGIKWSFNDKEVAEMLRIPNEGVGEFPRHTWPENKPDILEALFGNRRKSATNLMNAGMGTVVKAIHQVTVRGLVPRMEKTSNVHVQDACLIFDIVMKKKVKLAVVIMKHMQTCARSKTHGLPYPRLVKILLSNAGLYKPKKEVTLVHRFDASSLKKMNWGVSSEGSDMAEIEQKVDILAERVDEISAKCDGVLSLLRNLVAGLPSEKKIDEEVQSPEVSSERTSSDQEEEEEESE